MVKLPQQQASPDASTVRAGEEEQRPSSDRSAMAKTAAEAEASVMRLIEQAMREDDEKNTPTADKAAITMRRIEEKSRAIEERLRETARLIEVEKLEIEKATDHSFATYHPLHQIEALLLAAIFILGGLWTIKPWEYTEFRYVVGGLCVGLGVKLLQNYLDEAAKSRWVSMSVGNGSPRETMMIERRTSPPS